MPWIIFTRGIKELQHPQCEAGNSSPGGKGLIPEPQTGLCVHQSEAWQGLGCKSHPGQPSVPPAHPTASREGEGWGGVHSWDGDRWDEAFGQGGPSLSAGTPVPSSGPAATL